MIEITHIPKMQNCIKRVINLRGKIIPIADLRLLFGMEEKAYSERTCIIVIEVDNHEIQWLVGIIIDAVSEVVTLQQNEIEPPPMHFNKSI